MECIVSRADLAGSNEETSPEESPEPDVLEKFKNLADFDFVRSKTNQVNDVGGIENGGEEDEGLEFQLFAAPAKAGGSGEKTTTEDDNQTHRIRLRSPSLDPERVGFVRPHRSQAYYFARPLNEAEKRELQSVAVTAEQVLAHSRAPWPGSACGWKVLHLPPSGLSKDLKSTPPSKFVGLLADEQTKKRTRPGKKYRVRLRKRLAATEAKKESKRAADEAREATEREKRTRRNREKKVKRKAKEKGKKEVLGGEGEVEVEVEGGDGAGPEG